MATLPLVVLAFALAACVSLGTSPAQRGLDYTDLVIADALLTMSDLDRIRAGVWTEGLSDVRTLNEFACGLDRGSRVWKAPSATLSLTLNHYATAETAEGVFNDLSRQAADVVGYQPEPTGYYIDGLNQIWLGSSREGGLLNLDLLTRQGPIVLMAFMNVGHSKISDRAPRTSERGAVAGRLHAKVSSPPLAFVRLPPYCLRHHGEALRIEHKLFDDPVELLQLFNEGKII